MSPHYREMVNGAMASVVGDAMEARGVTEQQLVAWSGIDADGMAERLDGSISFTITQLLAIESALNLPTGQLLEQATSIARTVRPAGAA